MCLANPDRDESTDMDRFMERLTRRVKVPLMIDSTDAAVHRGGAPPLPGQGHRQLDQPGGRRGALREGGAAAPQYGGAVVVGCIDEDKQQGMAVTRQRKLAIAERSHRLLTSSTGCPRAT